MKALTLWQPWASFFALGLKTMETRSWGTDYRGPVAIHAATRRNDEEEAEAVEDIFDYLKDTSVPDFFRLRDAIRFGRDLQRLPRGVIVAAGELFDVVPTCAQIAPLEWALGDHGPGRFAWQFCDLRPIDPPIHYRGAQGLWHLPDSVISPG